MSEISNFWLPILRQLDRLFTAVAVEVLLKCCINSFAHKNKLIWQLMELFTNLKNLIILVTSCFVVIGHLCQS